MLAKYAIGEVIYIYTQTLLTLFCYTDKYAINKIKIIAKLGICKN